MLNSKIYWKSILYSFIFLTLLFSNTITSQNIFFSYLDEILMIFSCIILSFKKKKTNDIRMIVIILIVFVLGLVSNYYAKIQTNIFPILVDAVGVFKIFLVYMAFSKIINGNETKQCFSILSFFIKIFLIIAFVFLLLNYFNVVRMYDHYRYGFREYRFIFVNAGTFGYVVAALVPFLIVSKHNKFFVPLALLLIGSTFKGPQLIFVVLYIYFYISRKLPGWSKFLLFGFAMVIILSFSVYQLENYLLEKTSGRYLLIKYGFVTANNYIPFGSGFATYGSEMSRRYYSLLYFKYGFNRIWGMNLEFSGYINDNYWPMVIGQFGYFGFILFVSLYVLFGKELYSIFKRDKFKMWFFALGCSFMIGSVGNAYLTSSVGVLSILSICLSLKFQECKLDG